MLSLPLCIVERNRGRLLLVHVLPDEEPSAQCLSDMAVQGAHSVAELAWFILSTTLGRGVAALETKGFQYATPPVSMA